MSGTHRPPTYKGRTFGTVLLVAIQVIVGAIHTFFGFWLLTGPSRIQPFSLFSNGLFANDIYATYTLVFSILTLVFAYGLWIEGGWGRVGTAAILLFVIIADSLTLLDLPSVPGIPKFAGYGEITYSVILLLYLSQPRIRAR